MTNYGGTLCRVCKNRALNLNNKHGVCSYCYSKHPKLKDKSVVNKYVKETNYHKRQNLL